MSLNIATDWKEHIPPDEAARFDRYASELRALQKSRARGGALGRGLHAKQHVGAVGELVIPQGLPEPLRVALFAEPRTWPVYVRFSNGSGRRRADGISDVRGVALKLVGVPGRKIIPGLEDKRTQDFLFIQSPDMPVRTPDDFFSLVRAAEGAPALLLPRLIGSLGFGRTFALIRRLGSMPKVASMATIPFYTALPLRFGATAAKLALFPVDAAAAPQTVGTADALREDLAARLRGGSLTWSLRAQLFVDEKTTPIEDPTTRWPEDRVPFHEIARLVLPKQDPDSPRGRKLHDYVEQLSFDPWHAVEELRPLGAMMRARAVAYRESVVERQAAPEPDELVRFED
jgi:Catalase